MRGGETPEEALRREWMEECGFVIKVGAQLHEAHFTVPFDYRVRYYQVREDPSAQVIIADTALALGWFTNEEAWQLPGVPGWKDALNAI